MACLFFLLLFSLGFLITYCSREPRVKLGEHYIYCNPRAAVNCKKIYHLQLWDYDWSCGDDSYRAFLKQAIADFQKIYPNIQVEISLLDFFNGPAQLDQALNSNNAPDVYCSAYSIPPFNFKRQIPVGPYLKKSEKEVYLPATLKMASFQGVLGYFPRWIAPSLWIGNKEFLESLGLSVTKIQNEGWGWNDLITLSKPIPNGKFLLVGNLGANGFFSQLIASTGIASNPGAYWPSTELAVTVDFLENLIHQKVIPEDCDRNMLSRFLNGQAMILAGARPVMYNWLRKQLNNTKTPWQVVLLPVPSRITGKATVLAENSVMAIYRNKRTAGDDHLTAAVKFGQFLSCYQRTTPWVQLMVYPAAKEAFNLWLLQAAPNTDLFRRLAQDDDMLNFDTLNGYQEKVYPALNDFVQRKISGAELKLKLQQ